MLYSMECIQLYTKTCGMYEKMKHEMVVQLLRNRFYAFSGQNRSKTLGTIHLLYA